MNLDALRHRLTPVIRNEIVKAESIIAAKQDIEAIHKIAGPLVDMLIEIVRGIVEIYERSGMSVRRMSEVDPGETADRLADIQIILTHLEMLYKVEYIDLATRLSVIEPELAEATINELASQPEGMDKLRLFYRAIRDRLNE